MRPADELARIHLETAVTLKGLAFVQNWISQQIATPLTEITHLSPTPHTSGRGRKPGAAAADVRCVWSLVGGGQCKNTKLAGSDYCKIHTGKAAAISAAESGTGAAQLPSA